MRILFLSPWFPFPPTNGSELRINALLRGLAAEHDVTLISFQRRPLEAQALEEARALLSAVHLVPWRGFDPRSRRAYLGFLSAKPRSVIDTMSAEIAARISQVLSASTFDAIIASELDMAAYWPYFMGVPALLEDVELGIYRQQVEDGVSAPIRARRQLMWIKQRAYIRGLLPHFAACTVVSAQEKELVDQVAPNYGRTTIIPNCIRLSDYSAVRAAREPKTLIFTGAFTYGVNHAAMVWFLREVYPLVREAVPGARLVITGDHAGLPLPPAEGVTLAGFIDDVKPAVAAAAVSLVPIQYGGGTRLKILEGMALRTPVVSTTKGAEGLDVTHGRHLLITDSPESFASAIITLIHEDSVRQSIVENAYQLVREKYDWRAVMPDFLDLVELVAGRAAQPKHIHALL